MPDVLCSNHGTWKADKKCIWYHWRCYTVRSMNLKKLLRLAQIVHQYYGNGIKKNSNSTQFMLSIRRLKTFTTRGQVAEFKFESKFELLPVIWQSLPKLFQKTIEGFEDKIKCRALGAALRHSLRRLARVGRASTNTGRFPVGGSRCAPRPARLRNSNSVQESTRFKWFVNFGQWRITFFLLQGLWNENFDGIGEKFTVVAVDLPSKAAPIALLNLSISHWSLSKNMT